MKRGALALAVGLAAGLWMGWILWAPRPDLTGTLLDVGACVTDQADAVRRLMETAAAAADVMASKTAEDIAAVTAAAKGTTAAWVVLLTDVHNHYLANPRATSSGLPCPYTP